MEKQLLSTIDYLMIVGMFVISISIGVFFRFSGGKQKTTEEFLLAGKSMTTFPVAFSLAVSFLCAVYVVGMSAEMYYFGIQMAYVNLSYLVGMTISAYVTLPVYFEIGASTAYDYLDRRFGKLTSKMTSIAFLLQMVLYMAASLYAPALALSAITNLPTWVSVISIGIACTFYCTLGGMKAVLWSDVFQGILIYIGLFSVIIKGYLDMGFYDVFRIAYDKGRLALPNFDTSFYTRYTVWNIAAQGIVMAMSTFGANQVQIQRMLSVKNIQISRRALFLHFPMSMALNGLIWLVSIVVYAYFASCDPMTPPNKVIDNGDQLLPYYMLKNFFGYPGLAGICVCGIFSGALSSVSSVVNSSSAVLLENFIRPFLESRKVLLDKMSIVAQAITLLFGVISIALTFLIASSGNLVQAVTIVFGLLAGPILGVFLLGMLTTTANEKGVIIGLWTAILFSAWISFGSIAHGPPPKKLPISFEGCEVSNSSLQQSPFLINATFLHRTQEDHLNDSNLIGTYEESHEDIFALYKIAHLWFTPIGFIISFAVGYCSSILINIIKGKKDDVAIELLSPVIRPFISKNSIKPEENPDYHTLQTFVTD